jgi:hypothetical protein
MVSDILVLQKRVLRFIHSSDKREHAIPLFVATNILPVNLLYYENLLSFMLFERGRGVREGMYWRGGVIRERVYYRGALLERRLIREWGLLERETH